jgi:hypothetical protein
MQTSVEDSRTTAPHTVYAVTSSRSTETSPPPTPAPDQPQQDPAPFRHGAARGARRIALDARRRTERHLLGL